MLIIHFGLCLLYILVYVDYAFPSWSRAEFVIKCEDLWQIVKDHSTNHPPFDVLPLSSRRNLLKALVLTGSARVENHIKEEYCKLVTIDHVRLFAYLSQKMDNIDLSGISNRKIDWLINPL